MSIPLPQPSDLDLPVLISTGTVVATRSSCYWRLSKIFSFSELCKDVGHLNDREFLFSDLYFIASKVSELDLVSL